MRARNVSFAYEKRFIKRHSLHGMNARNEMMFAIEAAFAA